MPQVIEQYCTFWVDDIYASLNVLDVREVIRAQKMTPVPTAPEAVRGLINLRGEIVTAIDLRIRMGLPLRPPGRDPMNIIVQTADGPVSFLVDEIGDILELPTERIERVPETIQMVCRNLTSGLFSLENGILLVLAPELVANLEEHGDPVAC